MSRAPLDYRRRMLRLLPEVTGEAFDWALLNFPSRLSGDACWIFAGKRLIFRTKHSTTTPIRVIYRMILGEELHPTHRPHRTCHSTMCVNPTHHEIRVMPMGNFWEPAPVPTRLISSVASGNPMPAAEDEVEEIIDVILTIENGRQLSADDLAERFDGAYSREAITAALTAIKDQRL